MYIFVKFFHPVKSCYIYYEQTQCTNCTDDFDTDSYLQYLDFTKQNNSTLSRFESLKKVNNLM